VSQCRPATTSRHTDLPVKAVGLSFRTLKDRVSSHHARLGSWPEQSGSRKLGQHRPDCRQTGNWRLSADMTDWTATMFDGDGTLIGFRVYWPNGTTGEYARTKDACSAINISFDPDGSVNFMVGPYAPNRGSFSPLVRRRMRSSREPNCNLIGPLI
jgi:hypothetical protein